jgi:hypothetical protein
MILLALLAAALLLAAVPPVGAQADSGEVSGTVVNRYGEPLPKAAVRAEHLGEGFVVEALTLRNGTYVITNLPPGSYAMTASLGKAGVADKKIQLAPGQKLTLDFVVNIEEKMRRDPNYRPAPLSILGGP